MGIGVGTGVGTGVGAGVDEAGGTVACALTCILGSSVDDGLGGMIGKSCRADFLLFSAGFGVDFGRSVGETGALLETADFLLSEEEGGRSTTELAELITCVELFSETSGICTSAQPEIVRINSAAAKIRMFFFMEITSLCASIVSKKRFHFKGTNLTVTHLFFGWYSRY